jgi:ribosomal protein L40E
LSSTEATVLLRKGLEGDSEATKMAETILKNLDDQETTDLMNDDAHATLINAQTIIGDIKPGMSISEQKRVLHETTVIGNSDDTSDSSLICQNCNAELRATSKICGKCGTAVNSSEANN